MELKVKTNLVFLCSCGQELELLQHRLDNVITFKPCALCMLDNYNSGYDQRIEEEER